MGKLIPIILMLIGAGGGVGAGLMLRPSADADMAMLDNTGQGAKTAAEDGLGEPDPFTAPQDDPHGAAPAAPDDAGGLDEKALASVEYVALRRQLIVPLLDGDRVGALVVLSLSIEATKGNVEIIYDREPKLRDEFLQVLFRHANTGGFDGMFTSGEAMNDLKSALNAAARKVLGSISHQVLVTEILRQEM